MTSVFNKSLRYILILSKLFGFIDISYTLERAGLLKSNRNSTYYLLLEFSRVAILLICTYIYHIPELEFIQTVLITKFWVIILTTRIAESWIVKYVQ